MASFVEFLRTLLTDGRVVLRQRPAVDAAERAEARVLLADAYDDYRLDVAGPPLPFDAATALGMAERLWLACWFLVRRDEPPEAVERALAPPPPPASAAQHLSADLVLRFLPQVHRRARALDAADGLTRRLTELLRDWPLSGVLSDVEEGPRVPPEFDGHPGLLLLYAERLAERPRPAWVPAGPALPYVELAFAERNLPAPAPLPTGAPSEQT
jgi:hypothetical protein